MCEIDQALGIIFINRRVISYWVISGWAFVVLYRAVSFSNVRIRVGVYRLLTKWANWEVWHD